jgi:TonB family protein
LNGRLNRFVSSLMCVVASVAFTASPLVAQQTQSASASGVQIAGQQVVSALLKQVAIDPTVLVQSTGKPLPANGAWSVGKEAPSVCPQTTDTCLRVFYRVPDMNVSCAWVVRLIGDGSDGVILEQNEDAARYLLERLSSKDGAKLRISGQPPIYPPMARAAHVTGSVKVTIHVSSTGVVDRIANVDGPEMLRSAAEVAVKQWVYKPLMIGPTAVPFQTIVTLNFNMSG